MKIAIIGGGVSGLTTYLFFKKHLPRWNQEHKILIYEKYKAPSEQDSKTESSTVIGGGLGIGANGMRVLHELDEDLYNAVITQGYPATVYQMKTSSNTTLAYINCTSDKDGFEPTVISSRQGLWNCLRERVPDSAIVFGKGIDHVKTRSDAPPMICFQDGTTSQADLIIGADGAKSIVKKAVLGDGLTDEYPLQYEGLMGVGGFMPSSFLEQECKDSERPGHLVFTLGGNGFVGYGPCSSAPFDIGTDIVANPPALGPQSMWWSTFSSDTVPENTKDISHEKIQTELLERHGDWKDPVIRRIVQELKSDLFLPTWTTPKLPTWHSDGVILVGDAAHALPSSSGQGASQCFEDAYALALLLNHHLSLLSTSDSKTIDNSSISEGISSAAKAYEKLRKPRVEKILDQARRMGDQKKKKGVVAEWFMYLFISGFVKFGVLESWNRYVFDYHVRTEVQNILELELELES